MKPFENPKMVEAVALACMNVHGPYKGAVRNGLKISDINESTRSYIMEPYLEIARAAIEAMLGQLQMSEDTAFEEALQAEDIFKTRVEHFHVKPLYTDGYLQCLRDLGLVRDNEEKIKVDDYDARRHEEMYP